MKEYREKVENFFTKDSLKSNWPLFTAIIITLMAFWLRYLPAEGMEHLQALDSYVHFRISQHIAYEGVFPMYDFLRYFPYDTPTYILHQGVTAIPAVFYWLGPFLIFDSYVEYAQFFTPVMGALSVLFAYFLGKEMWGKYAGVSSAFFLATIAGIMHRSSAGFFQKEPIGGLMMMVSLYCFVRAWKRDEWISGIFSGLALGLFTVSWGGSSVLWMLYPLTIGSVMLLDEDIYSMLKAYTPTIIVGAALAASLNPGRFWLTDSTLLANIALLGFLWSRVAVEELKILEKQHLQYYTPSMSVVGIILLALSPLYSNFIASNFMSILNSALSPPGDVIAGTVAENTAMSIGELSSQLGANSAIYVNEMLGILGNIAGTWPLSFIGFAFLSTSVILMISRKYSILERTISGTDYYTLFAGVFLGWIVLFSFYFQASVLIAVIPAVLATVGGLILLYTFEAMDTKNIEFRWYYLLPFFWYLSSVLRATTQSRIIFLAAFPVAMISGYMFGLVWERMLKLDYSKVFESLDPNKVKYGALIAIILIVFSVNLASGYATVSNLSESPNDAWKQNLDYMAEETEKDAVMLSWWDYGYWFQALGERATVADGGNFGYFTSDENMPYRIADWLTDSNDTAHEELFEKHSVDYIVLDNTMIGKYTAVSQIANRDNQNFEALQQVQTPGAVQNSISQDGNRSIIQMSGAGANLYLPIEINEETVSVDIVEPPTMQTRQGNMELDCVLTENGRKDFDVDGSNYCVATDPYASIERGLGLETSARAVLVPKSEADSALVRLYLMDGYGMDWVEKVEEGSNGYVRMWEVTDLP